MLNYYERYSKINYMVKQRKKLQNLQSSKYFKLLIFFTINININKSFLEVAPCKNTLQKIAASPSKSIKLMKEKPENATTRNKWTSVNI